MPEASRPGQGAAVDYFLKIDGIPGESIDSKHKDEIQLVSWSWGESNSGDMSEGGGGGSGKVSMSDFNFGMKVNKASPLLLKHCATGDHIAKAVLTARKAGTKGDDFLKYTFTELLVSSYQTGGSAGEVIPVDQITLNFAAIEVEYRPQKPDGSLAGPIKVSYNRKESVAG